MPSVHDWHCPSDHIIVRIPSFAKVRRHCCYMVRFNERYADSISNNGGIIDL